METYTITGASGYIGSRTIRHLSELENTKIYAIVRPGSKRRVENENIEYVEYDGTEKSLEDVLAKSNYLIHLGGLYTTNIDENSVVDLINSNILFSTLLFNVANRVNKDLIIATASTFSFLNEYGEYAPATLYAATKKAVEDIAYFYTDLSIHFLTFPDTYGPDDWRPKIHNILARNQDWPFTFKSRGDQEMRLMHVEDIIGHLLSSLELIKKGVHIHDIYNNGILLTLEELSIIITDKECRFSETAELTNIPKNTRKGSTEINYVNKHNSVDIMVE